MGLTDFGRRLGRMVTGGGWAEPLPERDWLADAKAEAACRWANEQGRLIKEAERRRALAAANSREYRHRRALHRMAGDRRQCDHCGDNLGGRRSDARFCSDSCRVSSHRRQAEQVTTDTPLLEDSGKKASA